MSNQSKYLHSRSFRKYMAREIRKNKKKIDRLRWQYNCAQESLVRGQIMLNRNELQMDSFLLSCAIVAQKSSTTS